jgi:Mn-containing catalase
VFRHTKLLQFEAKPEKPDALYARKNCRIEGKYKDLIMDTATEEIGHVEMLATMVARLLEGAPATVTAESVKDPVMTAVLGGMDPQQVIVGGGGALPSDSQGYPWNGRYIVASGNLLADFRANAAAEAQGRLQTARLYNMTDDPGVKAMLQFNLARDTVHQKQWLAAIEELEADGLETPIAPSALFDVEDQTHNNTIWHLSDGPDGATGGWRWPRYGPQARSRAVRYLLRHTERRRCGQRKSQASEEEAHLTSNQIETDRASWWGRRTRLSPPHSSLRSRRFRCCCPAIQPGRYWAT